LEAALVAIPRAFAVPALVVAPEAMAAVVPVDSVTVFVRVSIAVIVVPAAIPLAVIVWPTVKPATEVSWSEVAPRVAAEEAVVEVPPLARVVTSNIPEVRVVTPE
jgi:hypothetical protein